MQVIAELTRDLSGLPVPVLSLLLGLGALALAAHAIHVVTKGRPK